jgi:hypothetical protein
VANSIASGKAAAEKATAELKIKLCSDGDGAHDDESTEGDDGSYAGDRTDDEVNEDEAKPAAERKRKANGKSKLTLAQMPKRGKCPHGGQRYRCKECGGAGICPHGRQRHRCKECGGASICEHGRMRSQCKDCGGSSICEHGRQRCRCTECGGASMCEHGRRRRRCKQCGATKGG